MSVKPQTKYKLNSLKKITLSSVFLIFQHFGVAEAANSQALNSAPETCDHGSSLSIRYTDLKASPVLAASKEKSGDIDISRELVGLHILLDDIEARREMAFVLKNRKCRVSFFLNGVRIGTQLVETAFSLIAVGKPTRIIVLVFNKDQLSSFESAYAASASDTNQNVVIATVE